MRLPKLRLSKGEKIIKAVKKGKMSVVEGMEAVVKDGDDDSFGDLRRIASSGDQRLRLTCEALIERNAVKAMKWMFYRDIDQDLREPLFKKTIAVRNLEIFTSLYETSKIGHSLNLERLQLLLQLDVAGWKEASNIVLSRRMHSATSPKEFFEFFNMEMPVHIRDSIFTNYKCSENYELVQLVSKEDPAQLEHYLNSYTDKTDANHYASLAANVFFSSGAFVTEIIATFDLLFSRGINVNHNGGEVLSAALEMGYLEQAKKLVAAGYEPALSAQSIYERLCKAAAPRASIDFIKQYVGAASIESVNAQDGFSRTDHYSVSYVHPLPTGGQLTMLFNFASGQQIVVAQVGEQLSAPTVVPFSQIENRYLLEKAADAFVADGGSAALVSNMTALRKPLIGKPSSQAGG